MGMDSLFFARADFRDKDQRKESKTLNMMWKGSGKSNGSIGKIFLENYFHNSHKKNKRNTYYHSDGQFSILISDDDLFTGMFSGHYSNPTGFCFDIACTDEPINDNPKLQGYNVEEKV